MAQDETQTGDSAKGLLRDYGGAILVAVLIAFLIRSFLIEAYRIPSQAMRPTLEAGDTVFVAKWPFGLRFLGSKSKLTSPRPPAYGEVVVFSPPSDPTRDYIKRVVGMPGDTVALRSGKLLLNGKAIALPSAKHEICGTEELPDAKRFPTCWEPPLMENFGPEKVPADSVFVLGDLRTEAPEAKKNRNWGIVPMSALKAKALWIWLSIEPPSGSGSGNWFSRIRFERMFEPIP